MVILSYPRVYQVSFLRVLVPQGGGGAWFPADSQAAHSRSLYLMNVTMMLTVMAHTQVSRQAR